VKAASNDTAELTAGIAGKRWEGFNKK
jgi:hypothetical protein